MTPFFLPDARQTKLWKAFIRWDGTPFSRNGQTAGVNGGVSCQKLAHACYTESGLALPDCPDGRMNHWRFSNESPIRPWIDESGRFFEASISEPLIVGDLMSFRMRGCEMHLGIWAGDNQVYHVRFRGVAGISRLDQDPDLASNIAHVYRPI